MKRITTGIEDFKELIDNNYYYIDKSQFIKVALQDQVSMFRRPRRFGKTLNMSMLYYFLSNKEKDNAYLFDGLKITENKEIMKLQNQFPVISITLKDMKDLDFNECITDYRTILQEVVVQYKDLFNSEYVEDIYKDILRSFYDRTSSYSDLKNSLFLISLCLEKHYHQKVVILIDEYDVPLQAAYKNGYYDEMTNFISGLLGSALKTNNSLYRGIMTGCLRIAKESIFTGLNNFKVHSIFDDESADCFGFTQKEIDDALSYYSLLEYKDKIREWYDGYLFGNIEIYNPWSTLYYMYNLLINPNRKPESYWANTSSNDIVYNYIKNCDYGMKEEFESLVQGHSIIKSILPELTYREMEDIENIYSFLLFTGYLKVKKYLGNDQYELVIPNKEVTKIYDLHFKKYFNKFTKNKKMQFVDALKEEDTDKANEILNEILFESVSFYDNYENFYHGFLVGLLSGYNVRSNREIGEGRFDISIFPGNYFQKCIVIECKKSEHPLNLEEDASKAVKQIIDKKYIEGLNQEGYRNVVGYGIAFHKKTCYIVKV